MANYINCNKDSSNIQFHGFRKGKRGSWKVSEIRDIIYSAPSLTSPPSARRSCWTQTLIWSAINSPCEKQQKVYAGLQFSVLTEWKSFLSAQHSQCRPYLAPTDTNKQSHMLLLLLLVLLVLVMNGNYRK